MIGADHRSNRVRPWHAEDIEHMAEMIFAGRTIAQMANELGRTHEAVRSKADVLGFLPGRARRSVVATTDALAG